MRESSFAEGWGQERKAGEGDLISMIKKILVPTDGSAVEEYR
jgi:hypothetical protein